MTMSIKEKMYCPHCGGNLHHVIDSRPRDVDGIKAISRRRICASCDERSTTLEFREVDLAALIDALLSERKARINALRAELAMLEAAE